MWKQYIMLNSDEKSYFWLLLALMVSLGDPLGFNFLAISVILSGYCSLTNKKYFLEFKLSGTLGHYRTFYLPQPTLESTLLLLASRCILYLYMYSLEGNRSLLAKSFWGS